LNKAEKLAPRMGRRRTVAHGVGGVQAGRELRGGMPLQSVVCCAIEPRSAREVFGGNCAWVYGPVGEEEAAETLEPLWQEDPGSDVSVVPGCAANKAGKKKRG